MELFTERLKLKDIFPEIATNIAKEYDLKEEDIEFVRKNNPLKPEDIKIEDGERAAVRYVNTADVDRDNEIVVPDGLQTKDFLKSPSVLYAHNYRGLPIGKDIWLKLVKGKGWLAKTVYAKHELATDVYNLVKDKFLNTNSIGFIPLESVKPDNKKWDKVKDKLISEYGIKEKLIDKVKRIYTNSILLEHSDVPIPSNINALNIAVGKGFIKSDQLIKDLEIEIIDEKDEVELSAEGKKKLEEGLKDVEEGKVIEIDLDKEEETWLIKSSEAIKLEAVEKPYPNEHSCRIRNPGGFKPESFRRMTRRSDGKEYSVIMGRLEGETTLTEQAYRYGKGVWSVAQARKHCKDHKGILFEPATGKGEIESILFQQFKKLPGGEIVEGGTDTLEKRIIPYKERWNKSLPECFDVERGKEAPTTFEYNLFKQFLECEVKNIFQNTYLIPSPLLGTYLAGFKVILNEFELKETRNFSYRGIELPPTYKVIRLNSTDSDDFLIEGMQFYMADKKPVIVKFMPDWYGIVISIVTSNKHKDWNKGLLEKAHKWAKENNYLKGEKFALNGEFLEKSEDNWGSLITELSIKDAIKKSTNSLEKKGDGLESRGFLFIGEPGTGKTKTGRIILNNVDTTFIWVSSRDFDRGGTRALSLAFSLARDLAPTVLFIEDIDTWLGGYIVDLLKTELDGLRQNKGIITILTSNSPEKLPDTLLDRPGRFHHVLRFPLPKAEFRKEMIYNWAGDIDEKILDEVIEKTEDFSGAHIKELVDFANMIADEEDIEIGEALLKSLYRLMAQRDLIAEIRENKKSLDEVGGATKEEGQEEKLKEIGLFNIKELAEIVNRNKGLVKENKELQTKYGIITSKLKEKIENLELKAGAVLNRKNKTDLNNAQRLIQNVLDSAVSAEEEGKETDELEIEEDNIDIEVKDDEDNKTERHLEGEEETIDISEDEIKGIISQVLNGNIGKLTDTLKREVGDNFKKMTGKVI